MNQIELCKKCLYSHKQDGYILCSFRRCVYAFGWVADKRNKIGIVNKVNFMQDVEEDEPVESSNIKDV